MGKIMKYCAACEEGFAAKFAFCPNCGGAMEAYEMNPVTGAAAVEPEKTNAGLNDASAVPPPTTAAASAETVETVAAADAEAKSYQPETAAFSTPVLATTAAATTNENGKKVFDDEYLAEETAAFAATGVAGNGATASSGIENGFDAGRTHQANAATNASYPSLAAAAAAAADRREGFHVTVIEEKHSAERNALLLGSWLLVMTLALGGVVYSLFDKELYAAGVGDTELMSAMVVEDVPAETEEEPPKPKQDKGGGGGGGGKEEEEPVSKGTPPRQTQVQLNPPTSKVPQFDAELKYEMSTVGNRDIKRTTEPIGDINGQSYKLSDGRGSGGGMGSGTGTGFGSGRGTGAGSGIGSGNGSGIGNGDGSGRGDGAGGDDAPPPPKPKEPVGPPTPVKILAKPKALYTDAARTNNVQGVVRVRVTLLASGQIGSVTPVNSLGYGLTEQALAAARQIKFEPAKKGGQAVTVTKVFEYTFTMY